MSTGFAQNPPWLVVREYNEEKDKAAVEAFENRCDFQQAGKPSLVTNLLGDPLCRVRHFPLHVMLVAEHVEKSEIVGGIRGCIKTVSKGEHQHRAYIKMAYVLGLRVSPPHRQLGVGTKLVQCLEEWCKRNGADYAYMATDSYNEASLNLFTLKCDYIRFRSLTILVQPVHAHNKPLISGVVIKQLDPKLASAVYCKTFGDSEFFPEDIDVILHNKLNLGTFMAIPKSYVDHWDPEMTILPPSFAILSIWNTKEVFRFQVKGVSPLTYAECAGSRVLDTLMPCLRLPSVPNFFKQFGVYFLYGLHMRGYGASRLMKSLCAHAHNMARNDVLCRAVVAEVGKRDPVREVMPHWRKFSWAEDIWCIKELATAKQDINTNRGSHDWITSTSKSSPVIFVDPRDF
ncbi:putative transcription regulator GNAT family [Helianthus annuus]|uniref:probable N-acetyltransferase HLS1 n=1 Tax=Helianthus annuus TaxID=4232 RepID=UPI000B8FE722|nr:probable N-acetyltransferase HLS1 [Helianthus annuus]KAJ0890637.1 putative transcription regulator GNAT family [Helianthus annuus]